MGFVEVRLQSIASTNLQVVRQTGSSLANGTSERRTSLVPRFAFWRLALSEAFPRGRSCSVCSVFDISA